MAHFNFLDFPENFKNCFRLHRKRRNPGCSLAVEYLYIYIHIYIYIYIYIYIPGESKKRPAFGRLLLPDYISNDVLQYLIK